MRPCVHREISDAPTRSIVKMRLTNNFSGLLLDDRQIAAVADAYEEDSCSLWVFMRKLSANDFIGGSMSSVTGFDGALFERMIQKLCTNGKSGISA